MIAWLKIVLIISSVILEYSQTLDPAREGLTHASVLLIQPPIAIACMLLPAIITVLLETEKEKQEVGRGGEQWRAQLVSSTFPKKRL